MYNSKIEWTEATVEPNVCRGTSEASHKVCLVLSRLMSALKFVSALRAE